MGKDTQNPEGLNDNKGENPEPQKTAEEIAAELKAEIEQLRRDNQEKDKTITELGTTVSTLKTRLSEIQPATPTPTPNQLSTEELKKKAKEVMEKVYEDPEKAGEELSNLLVEVQQQGRQVDLKTTANMVEQAISSMQYVEKVKKDNPELEPYEKLITARVDSLLGQINPKTGKAFTFKEALDVSIAEAKEAHKKVKKDAKASLPSGAGAETGAPSGPPAPPSDENKGEAPEEVIEHRRDEQIRKII